MRNKYLKKLICVSLLLILCFTIFSSTAYAEFPPLTTAGRRLGSWILSAITAANIALTSTFASSQGADIINFLGDPLDVTYSYTEMWDDRPTIQIWDDYVTIDGVTYTDIWISNEAAQKFKTDGLDFATAYSIASQTNGTFASGDGTIDGFPVFTVGNERRTQSFIVPIGNGSYDAGLCTATNTGPDQWQNYRTTLSRTGYSYNISTVQSGYPVEIYYKIDNEVNNVQPRYKLSNASPYYYGNRFQETFNYHPFDFDYVAGTIDADPLAADQGMMIRVPSDTPGLQQFITNNYYLTDPYVVDPTIDPDINTTLDDLADILAPILINLDNDDITFVTNHTEPAPVQDTLLPNTWWSTLEEKLDNIIQAISSIPSEINIPSYQTILQTIQQTISSINDKLGDLVDDIIQGIEEGPIKLVDKVIDALKNVFATILATLASALGIWHYVVEWIASISAPFTFIFGIMQGTSYNLVLPIYALIAGTIVIAVYRRFGQ